MAASFETPAQFERDLRSASKESKRTKDSRAKWSNGARPLHGCQLDWATMEATGGSDTQRNKWRPRQKWSECGGHGHKEKHNIIKTTRGNYELPAGRVRTKTNAREEIRDTSRSIIDILPSPRKNSVSDGFLYSFDRTDSPAHVLSLDVFIKPNERETEKLVKREYEILDTDGEALKGRKAHQNLRKATSNLIQEVPTEDDDGFELV